MTISDVADDPRWVRAREIVDTDLMQQARRTYKAETGKACANSAMRQCLTQAVYRTLQLLEPTP